MKKVVFVFLFLFLTIQEQYAQTFEFKADQIDIPYERFVLPNGLTLLVHEDHKAPIAAVNVWYHVGSKNEKPGKSGFAHLFEHLMFNGSENFNDDYFQALERIGGTDLNGTTNIKGRHIIWVKLFTGTTRTESWSLAKIDSNDTPLLISRSLV